MGAGTAYGTQRETIAPLLEAVGHAGMILSYDENRAFAAQSLNRFGAVGSTRLDWRDAEVLHRCSSFDGAALHRMLRAVANPGELAIVFWGNLCVPSIALDSDLLALHADAALASCYECWIHLVDSEVLIEFQDGEGFTAGRIPPCAHDGRSGVTGPTAMRVRVRNVSRPAATKTTGSA